MSETMLADERVRTITMGTRPEPQWRWTHSIVYTRIYTAVYIHSILQDALDLKLHPSRSALRTTKTGSTPGPGQPFGHSSRQQRGCGCCAAAAKGGQRGLHHRLDDADLGTCYS